MEAVARGHNTRGLFNEPPAPARPLWNLFAKILEMECRDREARD